MLNFVLCIFYHQKKGVTATWGMEMKGWNCLIALYQRGPRMIVLTGNVDGQFSAAFECSFTLKKTH